MRNMTVITLALAARATLADDTHYQDYVVGGRAAALGGAYTALADDPSGIYYNPAGLTDVKRLSLSVSTSLYGLESGEVTPGEKRGLSRAADLSFSDVNIIAGEAGGVKTFNLHPQRGAQFATGFVVEVPSYRNLQVFNAGKDETTGQESEYRRRLFDRTLWIGGGGAVRANHQWSFGLSAFYLLRTYEESEDAIFAWPASTGTDDAFLQRRVRLTASNGSALAILGMKFKGQYWSFGLALGSPTLSLHGGGEATFLGDLSDPDAPAGEPRSRHVQFPTPGEDPATAAEIESDSKLGGFGRMGLAYIWNAPGATGSWTWTGDVTVHLPTRYFLMRTTNEKLRKLLEDDFSIHRPVRRKLVVNGNTGFEYLVAKEFSFSVGAFTDFSSAPVVREGAEREAQDRALPHVNLFGATLAGGYFGEHSLTRLGVSFSTSVAGVDSVQDLSQIKDVAKRVSVDVDQSFLYIFLASTFRY